jgi:hypothetical protein
MSCVGATALTLMRAIIYVAAFAVGWIGSATDNVTGTLVVIAVLIAVYFLAPKKGEGGLIGTVINSSTVWKISICIIVGEIAYYLVSLIR